MISRWTCWFLVALSLIVFGQSWYSFISSREIETVTKVMVKRGAHGRLNTMINEASGICPSRWGNGLYWTHNDSLDEPRMFLIKDNGTLVNEVSQSNLRHVDWEACTSTSSDRIDGENVVYVADTGNNFQWRRDQILYVLKEENEAPPNLSLINQYPIQFPNSDRPPLDYWSKEGRCRDIESLFWREHELFVISKCIIGGPTTLWRIPREDLAQSKTLILQPVQVLPISSPPHPLVERVTDASYSSKHSMLAVLTYQSLWFYQVSGKARNPKFDFFTRCKLNQARRLVRQAEAVTWHTVSSETKSDQRASLIVLTESSDVYTYQLDLVLKECQ